MYKSDVIKAIKYWTMGKVFEYVIHSGEHRGEDHMGNEGRGLLNIKQVDERAWYVVENVTRYVTSNGAYSTGRFSDLECCLAIEARSIFGKMYQEAV